MANRDPIIATAIQSLGLMLARLMPLGVCIYLLNQLGIETGDERVLAELLALEIVSDEPTLLPVSPFAVPRLEDRKTPGIVVGIGRR
ncbi:MAG: hypothetical protein KDA84_06710 [Planctomycetaceae bacterium]|nr:hypothetical protein [Planctomycetaceae bacterium]